MESQKKETIVVTVESLADAGLKGYIPTRLVRKWHTFQGTVLTDAINYVHLRELRRQERIALICICGLTTIILAALLSLGPLLPAQTHPFWVGVIVSGDWVALGGVTASLGSIFWDWNRYPDLKPVQSFCDCLSEMLNLCHPYSADLGSLSQLDEDSQLVRTGDLVLTAKAKDKLQADRAFHDGSIDAQKAIGKNAEAFDHIYDVFNALSMHSKAKDEYFAIAGRELKKERTEKQTA